ncbi:hypothetical protein ACLM5J_07275 [Nocardioides sp. Bht2]|uniref:hypothetical protein n=1 Tax=Nocardioides sp. Bht2 TaxID=3392297 RepID=UPI0039B5E62D
MIAVLADAVRSRRTTSARLLDTLSRRNRVRGRRLIAEVLTDVAHGTCSVLEHRYLTEVERAHALPAGEPQARAPATRTTHRSPTAPRCTGIC